MRYIVRFLLGMAVLFCLVIIIFISWAKYTPLKIGVFKQKIVSSGSELENVNQVKIMSWNLGFAYGVGSEGSGYEKLTIEQMNSKLNLASDVIAKYSPDIVLIQEIDFDSSRSHNIDQLEFLAKKLNYPFYAYAVSWDKNYLPFPYFPIKNQWGKMKSGGAVLSRFPINENDVTLFDLPASNAFWYNWFYLFRYTQVVKIKINGQIYSVLNNHLEAFDKSTRQLQALELSKIIESINNKNEKILVVGGDFNTTPPNAKIKSNFKDLANDSYESDNTYSTLASHTFLNEVVSLDDYAQDESNWFTFSSVNPDRRLDYLFVGEDFKVIDTQIDKNQVSDHFPLISTLVIKN